MTRSLDIRYEAYASLDALPAPDRELARRALASTARAHAPYSGFRVGAAARLRGGAILTGSNQESEVFPAGMCAERVLLFDWQAHHAGNAIDAAIQTDIANLTSPTISVTHTPPTAPTAPTAPTTPTDPIEALAIASIPGTAECYPCGACRQTLLDTERRQGSPIRIIMCSDTTATVVRSAADLLPFAFKL